MKHTSTVLAIFLSLFILAQVLGLYFIGLSVDNITVKTAPTGGNISQVTFTNTSVGERPQVHGYESLLYIALGIAIGTILLLLLARFRKVSWWKAWFLFASWLTMSITIGVLTGSKLFWLAWLLAGALSLLKISTPNPFVHNITEIMMYIGIAVLLAPILSVWIAALLLVLIALYDAYAVWKSGHMITLAKFTRDASLFPGLVLSYAKKKDRTIILSTPIFLKEEKPEKEKGGKTGKGGKEEEVHKYHAPKGARTGVLGGGDVVFPLLFAGAVFIRLLEIGMTNLQALAYSIIISLFAALALGLLLRFGKKDRFYPAMPFIAAGCFAGYGMVALVMLF
jgi:presenilin-like A22 family membrane protease